MTVREAAYLALLKENRTVLRSAPIIKLAAWRKTTAEIEELEKKLQEDERTPCRIPKT